MNAAIRNLLILLATVSVIFVCCEGKVRAQRAAPVCGSPTRQVGFILGGVRTARGEFPWLVAMMNARIHPPGLIGGGTLISDRHVLTAAHCIKPKDGLYQLDPPDLIVQFGAFNISNPHELGKFALSPESIIIHSDWNPLVARYDADLALLVFEEGEIPMTRFIQPACLWPTSVPPSETAGLVSGWGKSEDDTRKHEELPRKIKITIRLNEDCLIKSPTLVNLFSKRTFCAGLDDGRGVCLGDSGSGFVFRSGGLAYLRGIVSSSVLISNDCAVNNYAIYTDVVKYKRWIDEHMGVEVSKEEVDDIADYIDEIEDVKDTKFVELQCTVVLVKVNSEYYGNAYVNTCFIRNQPIESEATIIKPVENAAPVERVNIELNKDVKFIPERLGQTFPELTLLQVQFCGVKSVQSKHFEYLRKLRYLSLFGNEIETIGSGSFGDLPSLQTLYLSNNEKIKTIDGNLLSGVPNLKYAWIDKIGLTKVPENLFRKTKKVVRICLKNNRIRYVTLKTFEGLPDLRTVILKNNTCANKFYTFSMFDELKKDLNANCSKKIRVEQNFLRIHEN